MDLIIERKGDQWKAQYGDMQWRCAVGGCGLIAADKKSEGDNGSPIGCWPLRQVFYRSDRMEAPKSCLPTRALKPDDGWCDAPSHPDYNRYVKLPFSASHEKLFRDDEVYDCIVVLGHNDDPVIPNAGSAIFLHIARPDYTPTEGCAAMARDDLLAFLQRAEPDTNLCFREAG